MNVTKAICILAATLCYEYCMSPRNSAITISEKKGDKLKFEPSWQLKPIIVILLSRVMITVVSFLYLVLMVCGSLISDNKAVQQLNDLKSWHWVALIISVAGSLLREWALVTLGQFFTYQLSIRGAHKLTQAGPYRYIRHPSYTGALTSTLFLQIVLWHQGIYDVTAFFLNRIIAIICGSSNINVIIPSTYFEIGGGIWIAVSLSSLLTAWVAVRIWTEEEMLSEHFKEKWTVYASHSWRLLPFVY